MLCGRKIIFPPVSDWWED